MSDFNPNSTDAVLSRILTSQEKVQDDFDATAIHAVAGIIIVLGLIEFIHNWRKTSKRPKLYGKEQQNE